MTSEALDVLLQLALVSILGSLEVEMFKEVRNSAVLKTLLSASGFNIDRDGGKLAWPILGSNLDSVV